MEHEKLVSGLVRLLTKSEVTLTWLAALQMSTPEHLDVQSDHLRRYAVVNSLVGETPVAQYRAGGS